MARPRGILRPKPARAVPKAPKSIGQKKIDQHMRQIKFSGHRRNTQGRKG